MSHRNSENDTEYSLQGAHQPGAVQGHVNAHFDSSASYWDGVYRGDTLQGLIYQRRQAAVLSCVDASELTAGAPVLEIGCGAGHLTIRLAERGLEVEAIDASPAMVEAAAKQALEAGLAERVNVAVADVHALPFESSHFDLIVAVGVIPWLHSPPAAVAEMARVLRPGGQLVVTADNRARLSSFTDPRAMLALSPLKRAQVALRRRRGLATSRLDYPRHIDRLLRGSGLNPVARQTIGFGPLSFFGRPLLGEAKSMRANDRLQALADRGVPGLKWTGWHYLVRAAKP
jgi:ubiquinone/menaquinone biosynthesis C-methylase UbiE